MDTHKSKETPLVRQSSPRVHETQKTGFCRRDESTGREIEFCLAPSTSGSQPLTLLRLESEVKGEIEETERGSESLIERRIKNKLVR